MKILRNLPHLDAKNLISGSKKIAQIIDDDLYDMLVRHTFDPTIYDVIMSLDEANEPQST